MNEEIVKLKERCDQLVKEKEDLANEMKKKCVSNEMLAVGFVFVSCLAWSVRAEIDKLSILCVC